MRGLLLLAALAALAACKDRRSFDERYSDTEAKLEAKARELDQNLAAADNGSESDGNTAAR